MECIDFPSTPLEITMVKLPKGRGCTLTPTFDAIRNHFYELPNVKFVLEQSLIRTRATFSVGDVVRTWHRGVQFDLHVSQVIPTTFRAVMCINTDIEVDIGSEVPSDEKQKQELISSNQEKESRSGFRLGTFSSTLSVAATPDAIPSPATYESLLDYSLLLPEPPMEQKENVCNVQIRYIGGQGKRRFAIDTATIQDLFSFAAFLMNRTDVNFQLVTRFPGREWKINHNNNTTTTLAQTGLQQGQELFTVEDF